MSQPQENIFMGYQYEEAKIEQNKAHSEEYEGGLPEKAGEKNGFCESKTSAHPINERSLLKKINNK